MESLNLPPLTPEQLQALDLGNGLAEFVDPKTQRVYIVSEGSRPHPCELPDDDTLLLELDEARRDIEENGGSTRPISEIIAEARRQRFGGE